MFSAYSHSGFCYTTISKLLLIFVLISSILLHVPSFHSYLDYFYISYESLFYQWQFWRLLTSCLPLIDTTSVLCGCLLIYYLRIFERRFGSRKFLSYLLTIVFVSNLLQAGVLAFLYHLPHLIELSHWPSLSSLLDPVRWQLDPDNGRTHNQRSISSISTSFTSRSTTIGVIEFAPGPRTLIFSLFVPFFWDVPQVPFTRILGIPISGKSFTYILGFQLATSSLPSALCCFIGLLCGVLYRMNLFWLQRWLLPNRLCDVSDRLFGHWLHSKLDEVELSSQLYVAATIEQQRQQQAEEMERRAMRRAMGPAAYAQMMGRPIVAPPQNNAARGAGAANAGGAQPPAAGFWQRIGGAAADATAERDALVERLAEMGFDRERSRRALAATGDDIDAATNALLAGSF